MADSILVKLLAEAALQAAKDKESRDRLLAIILGHVNQPFGRFASAQIGMKVCRQTAAFLVELY